MAGWRKLAMLPLMFAALAGNAAGVHAQAPKEATEDAKLVSSSWSVSCQPAGTTEPLLCEASQTIAVEKTRQTVLVAYVSPGKIAGVADAFVLRFQLPHGLDIPAGVQLMIDDRPVEAPVFQTSSEAGLFARLGLTDKLLAALKKGATMTVTVTALNGSKLAIPLTLDGFSAVFAKL